MIQWCQQGALISQVKSWRWLGTGFRPCTRRGRAGLVQLAEATWNATLSKPGPKRNGCYFADHKGRV